MAQSSALLAGHDAAPPAPEASRARRLLVRRLADVVCLPSSRVNAFERAMTADLLVELLREAALEERAKVARRLAGLVDIPPAILRLLLRDDVEVSAPLLKDDAALSDPDLIACARVATLAHRRLIAGRRAVSEVVGDALVEAGEAEVIDVLLRNEGARLSSAALETVLAASRDQSALVAPLLKRAELRPSHAYIMFWWAQPDARRAILQRFAVGRDVLQDSAGDIFAMASSEQWQDPLVRKAMQFIERRQRNRAALERSPYDSLEEAVQAAGAGLTRELASEIAYLAGLKPLTGAKILTDPQGEPLAILCKATGLPRASLMLLWQSMRRPTHDGEGAPAPALARTLMVFDMMAVDRAQTVLRYWNWALSSALTPALVRAIRERDEESVDEFSMPQRAAMLALQQDFRA